MVPVPQNLADLPYAPYLQPHERDLAQEGDYTEIHFRRYRFRGRPSRQLAVVRERHHPGDRTGGGVPAQPAPTSVGKSALLANLSALFK